MRQKSMSLKDDAETAVRDIRRKTRKQYSAEEKIRIVPASLRGEDSIAEVMRCQEAMNARRETSAPTDGLLLGQPNQVDHTFDDFRL